MKTSFPIWFYVLIVLTSGVSPQLAADDVSVAQLPMASDVRSFAGINLIATQEMPGTSSSSEYGKGLPTPGGSLRLSRNYEYPCPDPSCPLGLVLAFHVPDEITLPEHSEHSIIRLDFPCEFSWSCNGQGLLSLEFEEDADSSGLRGDAVVTIKSITLAPPSG